jgi:hypothetical protein
MYPGNHQCDKNWADNLLTRVKPFWGGEFQDIYSPVALHFLSSIYSTKAFDFLKFLKNKKPFALVGNQNIPSEIVNKLFGSECHHIKTPSENSFGEIDQVEFSLNNLYHNIKKDYYIIITSMGCSGRVLQKRIIKNYNNVFVFDFGSLMDALCGWNTRAWIELTKFDKDKFLNNL